MKQQTLIEMNVPGNAKCLPDIKPDGTYELLWQLATGSYVRLIFEDGGPVHEMLSKVVALETSRRHAEAAHGARVAS